MNDVMIRNCVTGRYLQRISLEPACFMPSSCKPLAFAHVASYGLVFENEEEAQATIDFISNVIDFETAECLEIVIVP